MQGSSHSAAHAITGGPLFKAGNSIYPGAQATAFLFLQNKENTQANQMQRRPEGMERNVKSGVLVRVQAAIRSSAVIHISSPLV